jgi:hypothetical protein
MDNCLSWNLKTVVALVSLFRTILKPLIRTHFSIRTLVPPFVPAYLDSGPRWGPITVPCSC